MAEAYQMLKIAQSNGTTDIVLTPHYPHVDSRSERLGKKEITARFNRFIAAAAIDFPSLNIYLGSEMFGVGNIDELIADDAMITLNGTRYVLTEFGFHDSLRRALHVTDVLLTSGYIPIIAHPERYGFIQRDFRNALEFSEKGALLQVNTSSVLGDKSSREHQTVMALLQNGLAAFAASDAHECEFRTPDMSEAYSFVAANISSAYADNIFGNNQTAVLNGRPI